AQRFAAVGASTLPEFRRAQGGLENEPRILLLLDGVAAFRQGYEVGARARLFDLFYAIAADGRSVGVHVVLTADRPASVPSALAAAVQARVVLRMADASDYPTMGIRVDRLSPNSPPGRGMFNGAEIQIAILGVQADMPSQVET